MTLLTFNPPVQPTSEVVGYEDVRTGERIDSFESEIDTEALEGIERRFRAMSDEFES